jgi:hypothetical protein
VLTRPGAGVATRSTLIFPKEIGFLVMRDNAEGRGGGRGGIARRRALAQPAPGTLFSARAGGAATRCSRA